MFGSETSRRRRRHPNSAPRPGHDASERFFDQSFYKKWPSRPPACISAFQSSIMPQEATQFATRNLPRRRFPRQRPQLPLLGKLYRNRRTLRKIQVATAILPHKQIRRLRPKNHLIGQKTGMAQNGVPTKLHFIQYRTDRKPAIERQGMKNVTR